LIDFPPLALTPKLEVFSNLKQHIYNDHPFEGLALYIQADATQQ
jgi:hypothetical protein